MSKTVKVKHPVFKDVVMSVKQDELADYLAAGWLESNQRRKATVTDDAEEPSSPSE